MVKKIKQCFSRRTPKSPHKELEFAQLQLDDERPAPMTQESQNPEASEEEAAESENRPTVRQVNLFQEFQNPEASGKEEAESETGPGILEVNWFGRKP